MPLCCYLCSFSSTSCFPLFIFISVPLSAHPLCAVYLVTLTWSSVSNLNAILRHTLQVFLSHPSFSSYLLSLFSAGMKELSPPPLNLRRLYTETLEWEPVLIIISPGADPSQELAELAAETVGRDNYHEVENNMINW